MPASLFNEHREIILAAEQLLATLQTTPPAPLDEISQLRAHIGSLTLSHLRNEEALIIGPLLTSRRIEELPDGHAIMVEIRALRSTYSNHIRVWTPQAISNDRAGYTKAVTEITRLMKLNFEREEQYLHLPAIKLLHPAALAKAERAAR